MTATASRLLSKLAVIVTTMGLLMPAPAIAAVPESSLVFILDASGSMWGRIAGDEMKITAAKSVMRDLLNEVPDTIEMGLVAYGHRRKGDCADIETIAELGAEPSAISDAVEAITPRGKTPITDALRSAADLVSGVDRPSTLVLVSDGIETCQGDPCALASELKKSGTELVIHTVGFAVDADAERQLQCVAEAGGGNYYHTENSTELRDALFSVRQSVAQNTPAPPPPAPPSVPRSETSTQTIRLAGPGTIRLKPAEWVGMPPYYWTVLNPETGDEVGRTSEPMLRVKAGEYQIGWHQIQHGSSPVALSEIVSVASGETVEVPIDTGIRIIAPEGVEAPYRWWLQRPGEDEPVASFSGTLDPQVVPAGRYRFGWHQTQHQSRPVEIAEVEIEAGTLNDVVIDHGLQVTAAEWVPGDPEAYRLIDEAGDVVAAWSVFGTQVAPAGTFRFEYEQSEHGHNACQWGTVTIPEDGFAQVPINSGVRFKVAADTPLPYRVTFTNLDTEMECHWNGSQRREWEAIPLPPGRYRLDWHETQHGSEEMTLLDEFTIGPGTLVEFEM